MRIVLMIKRKIKQTIKKMEFLLYSSLPNIVAMTPPTKEEIDAWKARRNPDVLWADEIQYDIKGV